MSAEFQVSSNELFRQSVDVDRVDSLQVTREIAIEISGSFKAMQIGNNVVNCPYWMNNNPAHEGTDGYRYVPRGGKLSCQEVVSLAVARADQLGLKIDDLETPEAVHQFLFAASLGVDCSGYAYQIAQAIHSRLGGVDFDSQIVGRDGAHGITRTGARELAGPLNSRFISNVMGVLPGDFIRCSDGRHIIVVIDIQGNEIVCSHSTDMTSINGVHDFRILVTDVGKDIFDQVWAETLNDGSEYSDSLARSRGELDGVWRLRVLEDLRS